MDSKEAPTFSGSVPVEPTPTLVPAVAMAIYFRPVLAEYRDPLLVCLDEFLAEHREEVGWYADEDLGKLRPATPRRLARPFERLRSGKPLSLYAFTMFSGGSYEEAGAVSLAALVRDPLAWAEPMRPIQERSLCFLRVSLPLASLDGVAGVASFVDRARRWSERLPHLHGYAGLSLEQPEATGVRQRHSRRVLEVARRHPGFEVDDCGGTVLVAREALKGVSWLTLVGRAFVERLGGFAALRRDLPAEIAILDAGGGGCWIQAGPLPSAGDLERGDVLPLYREVARVLRPVRLGEHPALGPSEHGSFGPAGTAEWLRRFD